MEFTVLMPAFNEEETIEFCINEIKASIDKNNLDAEILVADNNSTDKTKEIAESLGARVVTVSERGYGAALLGGIKAAEGKYVIMGDSDGSYAFNQLEPFVEGLRRGFPLVMGNRFKGGIEKGAMPFLHKLGVPVLSTLARWRFGAKGVYDFHCGLRGFDREKALALNLSCTGMEFATEIIAEFARAGHKILEVPTPLRCDRRSKAPHLKTFRDGWRHLKFIMFK